MSFTEIMKEIHQEQSAMKSGTFLLDNEKIARETEKAIGYTVTVASNYDDDKTASRIVWVPKSQIKNNKIEGWLYLAKVAEVVTFSAHIVDSFATIVNGEK